MAKYKYKVWNDGRSCPSHCFINITHGDRVVVEREFIEPGRVFFISTNKLIEANLKKGIMIAEERIKILIINEVLPDNVIHNQTAKEFLSARLTKVSK